MQTLNIHVLLNSDNICIMFSDAELRHFLRAARSCVRGSVNRKMLIDDLQNKFTTEINPNPALVTLSVRTAFDLFLTIKNYPPGSQIIMSAINIPDMVHIVKHHKLKPVPLDVSIENMSPKAEMLEALINEKTVAIVLAHVYGKWINTEPFLQAASKYNLAVIEDCAEVFCGFERLGNPQSDISLFSFGVIKNNTAFGGCIAKIKDTVMYDKMLKLNSSYPMQSHSEYFKKLIKCLVAFTFLHCHPITKPGMYLARFLNIDHKKRVVGLLRGFPNQLIEKIRHQPCDALLKLFWERMTDFDEKDITLGTVKGDYVSERLPENVICVGQRAAVNNYWLYPVLVVIIIISLNINAKQKYFFLR